MDDRLLENLIRQAVERDDFLAGRPRRLLSLPRRLRAWVPVAVAAAVGLVALYWPVRPAEPRPSRAAAVSLDFVQNQQTAPGGLIQSCAERSAVAIVLFRVWEEDCQCIAWQVHQGPDGSRLVHLRPDESIDIPVSGDEAPAVEQFVFFAVATEPQRLPASEGEAAELLACLNGVCPPGLPGEEALGNPSALLACLPDGITLVRQSFVVD